MFSDLITSKSRVKLLNVFLANPNDMFHVRELVRRTKDEINAVRRELSFLEQKGILTREPRANRVYYSLSKGYPFYFDLLKIGSKNIGLGEQVLKNRVKLGKIKYAMLSACSLIPLKNLPENIAYLILPSLTLFFKTCSPRPMFFEPILSKSK
jgi:DNA-binding transcriptional ArsR family regulator